MSGEWIEWKGGACPVPIGTKVEVRHRSGAMFKDAAGLNLSYARDWKHSGGAGDILAYRVLDEDKSAADGWIEWNGGDNPCGPGAVVEWKMRAKAGPHQEFYGPREADLLHWGHRGNGLDIVAFRVVGQVKLDSEAPAATATVESTLSAREETHGDFRDVARIAQRMKATFLTGSRYAGMANDQQESLDMIASKIARILSGNPNEPDHWHDIAGYARLVEQRLRGGV